MSFQDRVGRDIGKVFLDTRFFAESRTVRYDGAEYPDIPVSFQEVEQTERQQRKDDHAQGFYRAGAVLFCAQTDLGDIMPEQGTWLEINSPESPDFFDRYRVVSSFCEMGMLKIQLEVTGQ